MQEFDKKIYLRESKESLYIFVGDRQYPEVDISPDQMIAVFTNARIHKRAMISFAKYNLITN